MLKEFLKFILLAIFIMIIIVALWLSPFWYQAIKNWHSTHTCEVQYDCFETNVTPNMCTNEKWIYYYSHTKNFEKISKNSNTCQCSNYIVTNICTKK